MAGSEGGGHRVGRHSRGGFRAPAPSDRPGGCYPRYTDVPQQGRQPEAPLVVGKEASEVARDAAGGPEGGDRQAGGAAPDRTDSCTSRSSSRCAAIAAAPATERSSRKTAPPQPFVSDPVRPLAPSEGSNTWIERPRPRRVRRRLRTASPRSSSGRPTHRVSRPPRPPSAHRSSRASRERLASRGNAESGPRTSERTIGRRRAARHGAGRPPPRRPPRSGGPDRTRLNDAASADCRRERCSGSAASQPRWSRPRRTRPRWGRNHHPRRHDGRGRRIASGPDPYRARRRNRGRTPTPPGHARRARPERRRREGARADRREPARRRAARWGGRRRHERRGDGRNRRAKAPPPPRRTRPEAVRGRRGSRCRSAREAGTPRSGNRSGRSDRSGPADRRRSRNRWHPGDRRVGCDRAPSVDGVAAGSGSSRSCRPGSPTSSW